LWNLNFLRHKKIHSILGSTIDILGSAIYLVLHDHLLAGMYVMQYYWAILARLIAVPTKLLAKGAS
jgi:hypothetical protein